MNRVSTASTVFALCLALSATLSAQPGKPKDKASLSVMADRTSYDEGGEVVLAAVMTIDPDWHTNSNQPTFDYLIATEVTVVLPAGWPEVQVSYPPGEMKTFAFADQPISVYEGRVAMLARFTLPAGVTEGEFPAEVSLRFQACDDRSCLPPVTTSETVPLRVGAGGRLVDDPVFKAGPTTAGRSSVATSNIALILVLGFVGGIILNAMPCVLPVLSLKIFGLVKSAGKGRTDVVVGALATALGILLSFWALAAAAIMARAAGSAVGWGIQFQQPTFVAALAVIVVLFCLNLWGIFEIALPRRLAQLADSGPKQGIPGHLVSGLFATLMATPCSAPFLGTAVGFALSQPPGMIVSVFTSIALGMSLPYLLLAAAPDTTRFLPRPGDWMDRLRVVMGFLLAGAAVWLFYVLAAQLSRERLAFIELSLLCLALFTWWRHQSRTRHWVRALALIGVLMSIGFVIGLASGAESRNTSSELDSTVKLINWLPFDRVEAERLAASGRLVFVDVTADWCFTCKVNERLVLETELVADTFEEFDVIAMKADWTNRSDEISRFLADHGRYGIPFYLLYRPGADPHLFPELLSKDGLIDVVEQSAGVAAEETGSQ